jgi:ParE toxin of type II toxin-antitoxin system, parDE
MVPVIYAPEAERDLDRITAYIAKDNPKAAEQFGYRLIARAPSFSVLFQTSDVPCTASATSAFCWKAQFKFTIVWGMLVVL